MEARFLVPATFILCSNSLCSSTAASLVRLDMVVHSTLIQALDALSSLFMALDAPPQLTVHFHTFLSLRPPLKRTMPILPLFPTVFILLFP
jgi:hypothetical protein